MAGNQEIIAGISGLKDGDTRTIARLGEVKIAIEKAFANFSKFDNFPPMIAQN